MQVQIVPDPTYRYMCYTGSTNAGVRGVSADLHRTTSDMSRAAETSIYDCAICLGVPGDAVHQCRSDDLFCAPYLGSHYSSGSANSKKNVSNVPRGTTGRTNSLPDSRAGHRGHAHCLSALCKGYDAI